MNIDIFTLNLSRRPMRNRKSEAIRSLVQETRLHPSNLVAPLFVLEGEKQREEVESMPGVYRQSIDFIIAECIELHRLGVKAVDLFPVVPQELKNRSGTEAYREGNLMQQAVRAIKREVPDLCVMLDVALDPYTDHGHDGLMDNQGRILNDATVQLLAEMSLLAADAGVDVIAPSDMMDGRIGHIRGQLDLNGFENVSILAYSAKYASSFYGPFRDALHSSPKFGDKKTYQMDPANIREAILEAKQDEAEGADMLMVKPALPYLDVITRLRDETNLPIAAYHVSGEYAMVMAAAEKGWIDGERVMLESLQSIKRAGADFILTYAAKNVANLIASGR